MLFILGIASPVLSIIIGILILLFPELLSYLVAIYLILTGILGLVVRNLMFW